jgi:hypothetical protein
MKALLLALSLALVACHSKDEPPPVDKPKAEGRAETKSIRNTQAIGYDGKAIADKLDAALDKNDQHAKEVEKQSAEEPADK